MTGPCEKCKKAVGCRFRLGLKVDKPCYPRMDYMRGLKRRRKWDGQ